METLEAVFLPGNAPPPFLPLNRFMPPLQPGMAAQWLAANHLAGEWVLDPLGASPTLALEAARAGCRILVACNNPVVAFVLEVLASAPAKADFQAALADLADIPRGGERLETHLNSLYQTDCDTCGQPVVAQAYLWKRGEPHPFARTYTCTQCGFDGERPWRAEEQPRLSEIDREPLHRARALSRICSLNDPVINAVEDALKVYLHRPLYFLTTFINRLEGLAVTTERRRLLQALALSACDEGNNLWSFPSSRPRPRQLSTPLQFREKNLWAALEEAIRNWTLYSQAVPCTRYPHVPPPEGGICIFPSRLKALLPLPVEIQPKAVVTVLPRPNQAFWTLSAIWSGWLWGREAVTPLKGALERRRYDWDWHATALHNLLNIIHRHTPPGFPIFAIVPEADPGFMGAALIAAATAGMRLQGIALRAEQAIAQLSLTNGSEKSAQQPPQALDCRRVISSYLRQRREPIPLLDLHTACLKAAVQAQIPIHATSPTEALSSIQSAIEQTIAETSFLMQYDTKTFRTERTLWWLTDESGIETSTLSDLIELAVLEYLQAHSETSVQELDQQLCAQFRGLLTPPLDLVLACLESYGEILKQETERWGLRERERLVPRQNDTVKARYRLKEIGARLGYSCTNEDPLVWLDSSGSPAYLFQFTTTSAISQWVLSPPRLPDQRNVLVVPGSRSNLLMLKLQRDPRLAQAASAGWRILKFRHVRRMLDRLDLTPALWEELLEQDPPRWEDAVQIKMFGLE
ncbi:MAG: hypothetical protein U1B80_05770 [Anaerolineaceae bacterium]|nr:hypothetical protein [Anaerolineaceae bacterium]